VETLQATKLADGLTFGEGPRWHDGRLWCTDGPAGAVRTVDEHGALDVAIETDHPSGLGWLPDGTLLISTLYRAQINRVGPGARTAEGLYDLSDRGWSTNDMVVGPDGRTYVDLYRTGGSGDGTPVGDILLVTPDGEIRAVATDLATPNGLAITPDGATLLASETFGCRILAFDIAADGSLSGRRVFADLGEGKPDGLCLDAAGAAWVGCYDTGEFLRVLDGGEVTHRIETPGAWAVAPALGGPDRRTLYLIVNQTTTGGMQSGASTGWIEQVQVEVPGAGSP
jgi:sugar lactone lactonase YvrE